MLGMFKKVNNIADSDQTPHSDKLRQIEGTCIGETNFIQGSISGEDDLLIQGSVKGNIDLTGHQLTVGPKGNVEADIKACQRLSKDVLGNIKLLMEFCCEPETAGMNTNHQRVIDCFVFKQCLKLVCQLCQKFIWCGELLHKFLCR